MTENRITEVTRRALFDELIMSDFNWAGRLSESGFLGRVFDLTALPSDDSRHRNMAEDVSAHRDHWGDWGGSYWVYDDNRLHLMRCEDDVLLSFLAETLNPVVRSDEEEVARYAAIMNKHLVRDGIELYPASFISGRPIFAGREHNQVHVSSIADAQEIAVTLNSTYIMAQITRMRTIENDPALTIGSAKEFVETIYKTVLTDKNVVLPEKQNLPQLVRATLKTLDMFQEADAKNLMRNTVSALTSLTHALAELRGRAGSGHGQHHSTPAPSPILARLARDAAITLGVFLFEAHTQESSKQKDFEMDGGVF